MALTGAEPIIDSIRAVLLANMPAKLDALEAALSPTIALADPTEYSFGIKQLYPLYPAIAVEPIRSPIPGDNVVAMDFDHTVGVIVFVTDIDEQLLGRKLLRYTRAVLEVMATARAAGTFTTFGMRLVPEGIDYSPTLVPELSLFQRDVFIPFVCRVKEVRP